MKHFLLSALALSAMTLSAAAATPMYDDAVEPAPSLKVNSVTWTDGVTVLKADYDNNISYSVEVSITNNGNVDLTPGDENYSLTFLESEVGDIATYPVTSALAVGETATVTIAGTMPASMLQEARTINDRGTYWCNFRVRDNIKNTSAAPSWIDVYPMWIYCDLVQGSYNQKVTSIDFGFVAPGAQPERTVRLRNLCINPLTVNYIIMPEGFELVTSLPFELTPIDQGEAADRVKDITFRVEAQAVGVLSGDMQIFVDGAEEPLTVKLNAARAGGDAFFEGFESTEFPAGWIIDSKLALVTPAAAVAGEGNVRCLGNSSASTSDKGRAITPRLSVQAGDKVMFQAGSNNISSYSDPVVDVYYSPDRANWTLLKEIRNPYKATEGQEKFSESAPGLSSEGSALLIYTVDLPEGEGYLAFDILYARIDNVFGAHAATVDHDLLFSKTTIPTTAMVNNRSTLSFEVRNVAADTEEAGTYTLHLMADGQEVDAITETPELPNGYQTFSFNITPHQAGNVVYKAQLRSGDFILDSEEKSVVIADETCEGVINIAGAGTMTKTGSNIFHAPTSLYYKKTLAEMIYTEDMLTEMGLSQGAELTGMRIYGYSPKTSNTIQILRVYIEPTELSVITPADKVDEGDLNEETMVCDMEPMNIAAMGTQTEPVAIFSPVFDTPYVWNGGNLRVTVRIELLNYDTSAYAPNDASLAPQAIMKGHDTSLSSGTWKQAQGMAHTELVFAKTPVTYTGTVESSENHTGIAGADITLTSGDVLYNGTSAQDGTFSINVIQSDKQYDVTVAATDYNDYTGTVSFDDGNVNQTIQLVSSTGSGVSNLTADGLNLRVHDEMITVDADATLRIFATSGTMISRVNGNAISTRGLAAGVYILTIESAHGNTTVRFVKK